MSVKILKMNKVNLGKTRAFFTAAIGELEVEGLKLVEGKNGMFVGWPSRSYESPKDGSTKWVNIVQTSNKKLQSEITEAAMAEYERREGAKVAAKTADLSLEDETEDEDLPF